MKKKSKALGKQKSQKPMEGNEMSKMARMTKKQGLRKMKEMK